MEARLIKKAVSNSRYYNFAFDIVEVLYSQGKVESAISLLMKDAWFWRYNYCGYYTDERIEKFLQKIAQEINIPVDKAQRAKDDKNLRILHIATEIYETGGHARGIDHWIGSDMGNNQHDILLTNQNINIPSFFAKTMSEKNGHIYLFNKANAILEKIGFIRNTASAYDIIVLHHHPNDVTPVIALAKNNETPVAILNHAYRLPWVGSSICDCLIEIWEIEENDLSLNLERRHINKVCFIPYNLKPVEYNYVEVRNSIGIGNELVLLSIGSPEKFKPNSEKNFFEDITPIINQHTNTRLLVVGIAPDSELGRKYAHPRIEFIGLKEDIEVYKQACDIFIDCYPKNSSGAMLEVGLYGKPCLLNYSPSDFSRFSLRNYKHKLFYPSNKAEWQSILNNWITNEALRKTEGYKMYENINGTHVGENWQKFVDDFYNSIKQIKHKNQEVLPNTFTYTDAEEEMMRIFEHNPEQNLYLMKYFRYVPLSLKFRIILSRKSFNLHSIKLFVYYLLGKREKI